MITQHSQTPALLCVGPKRELIEYTLSYLKKYLCPHGNEECGCKVCRSLMRFQSPSALWIEPSGSEYILDDLAPLSDALRFSLAPDQRCYLIIQDAHLLSATTANALLKAMEEPPQGYQFILLTHHPSALLATVQSRTTLLHHHPLSALELPPIASFFTNPAKLADPQGFDAALKGETFSAHEAKEFLHTLVAFGDFSAYSDQEAVRSILRTAQENLPQQGGGPLFLRWLYLTFHHTFES